MLVSIPLIASHAELSGAIAPLSVSLVIGAFIFGAAMQVADGCGSGTLYKAGLGNGFSLAVLPGFIAGSFLGAAHLDRWLALGSLPPVSLPEHIGVGFALAQLAVFGVLGTWLWRKRKRTDTTWKGRGIYVAAVLLAVFGVLNLIIAGQPWGIVYGLGLWGAKIVTWFGADLATNAYWGGEVQQAHLQSSLLTDVTSVTNIGLLIGALITANFRGRARPATQCQRQTMAGRSRYRRRTRLLGAAGVRLQRRRLFLRYLDRQPARLGVVRCGVCRFVRRHSVALATGAQEHEAHAHFCIR